MELFKQYYFYYHSWLDNLNYSVQLNIQTSNIDSSLEGGAQKQQMFNVECVYDFTEPPILTLHFL